MPCYTKDHLKQSSHHPKAQQVGKAEREAMPICPALAGNLCSGDSRYHHPLPNLPIHTLVSVDVEFRQILLAQNL